MNLLRLTSPPTTAASTTAPAPEGRLNDVRSLDARRAQEPPKLDRFTSLYDAAKRAEREITKHDPETVKQARESAETLVAQTLLAPLLAQMRENNHAAEPFGVSQAEKRLGPVFDEKIAVAMVRRSNFNLVDAVQRSILKRTAANQGAGDAPRGRLA